MAMWNSSALQDAALRWMQNNAQKIVICSGTISTANTIGATVATCLARTTLSTGSFSLSDDSTYPGRKLTVAQQSTLAVLATGVADRIYLYATATVNSTMTSTGLFYMTSCATQNLDSTSNKVTIPAFSISISDATST